MKLTKKKVKYIVRWKERGKRSREIAKELKISKRRVNQIWKEYRKTKERDNRRGEENMKEAKKKYKLGARRLELVIDRDYRVHIPHNRIL